LLLSGIAVKFAQRIMIRNDFGMDTSSQFAEKLRFASVWEGHEFHSCRNRREINSGFQPLGGMPRSETLFPQPFRSCR